MALTLVPAPLARPGAGFTFRQSDAEECAGCPFKRLCLGLEVGHRYEVQRLRGVWHPCALHDGAKVQVAEVEEAPFPSSIERRHLRGTAATWTPVACGMPECANYALCHPQGPRPGRHEIVSDEGGLECPAGFELSKVRLRPMD